MEVKELEKADFDILENVKVAFRDIWKKKIFVALFTIVGILMSIIYIGIVGNTVYYVSTASVFSAAYGDTDDSYSGVTAMNTNANLIGSTRVCERAASSLKEYNISAEHLKSMAASGRIIISGADTSSKSYGYTLYITVYSQSPERVEKITNAMASAYANEVNDLIGTSAIQVMDEARGYTTQETINVILYLLIGGALGFILSCGFIFVKAFFSPWVLSAEQCEMEEDKIIGLIPYSRN